MRAPLRHKSLKILFRMLPVFISHPKGGPQVTQVTEVSQGVEKHRRGVSSEVSGVRKPLIALWPEQPRLRPHTRTALDSVIRSGLAFPETCSIAVLAADSSLIWNRPSGLADARLLRSDGSRLRRPVWPNRRACTGCARHRWRERRLFQYRLSPSAHTRCPLR